jgi:hypothetical protein
MSFSAGPISGVKANRPTVNGRGLRRAILRVAMVIT